MYRLSYLSLLHSQQGSFGITFFEWVLAVVQSDLPTRPLGAACRYAKDQRPFVHRCFADGRFELDNGRVERKIGEPAGGGKNYLFSGSAAGAARLASANALVQSAGKTGIPIREYLMDVLRKLAGGWKTRRLAELAPTTWLQAREGAPTKQQFQQPSQG
jgi:hypothetical protein